MVNSETICRTERHHMFEDLALHFSRINSKKIEKGDILESLFILLADKYDLLLIAHLWNIPLEYDEALDLLSEFNFQVVLDGIETSSDIIPGGCFRTTKASIKSNGLIWRIHKDDKDPFPSNPHAHLLDGNRKLDLSTGLLYRRTDIVDKIKKKDLLNIRNLATQKKIELPPLLV